MLKRISGAEEEKEGNSGWPQELGLSPEVTKVGEGLLCGWRYEHRAGKRLARWLLFKPCVETESRHLPWAQVPQGVSRPLCRHLARPCLHQHSGPWPVPPCLEWRCPCSKICSAPLVTLCSSSLQPPPWDTTGLKKRPMVVEAPPTSELGSRVARFRKTDRMSGYICILDNET